ncbi:MAG: urease accessory protein UreF [Muribaculaceae bacterium]|nr:urease accessory protein UreF [Muribaculaceae bacterium]MDE6523857.1 urease accessory protein UreF [Muribaculaceae bacterium]MDE6786788.1 urease accessory protein UreF [Muribaculaceae bacterium]
MKITSLLQMTDSTFPVGTFSFSNGLETASHIGIVHDADTLEQYTRSVARQGAFSDGVAALLAYRATNAGNLEEVKNIDRELMLFKMNDEARMMLQRMGKKLAELGVKLFPDCKIMADWLEDIKSGATPGTYPIAQGISFAAAGLSEEDLFASHQYGVINMVLSAALRCVRVSHYDTQLILQRLCAESDALFEEAKDMTFEDMNSFVPEMDIFASLHEKGNMRMFMN